MAVTILNPARFNDDGGLGTRRFIRTAFFDEGYGVSSSFYAYRQGGGIVPATSAFDIIGAGTPEDPLRMSQFSGFVVPSQYLDVQTITPDVAIIFSGDFTSLVYWHGYASNNGLPGYPIGSISDGTSNIYSGAVIEGILTSDIDPNNPDNDIYVYLRIAGSQPNSGWTTITFSEFGKSYNRSSASFANYGSQTEWIWLDMEGTDPINYGPGTTEVTWS